MNMGKKLSCFCLAIGIASLSFSGRATGAETYPSRPVRLIDPYAPGGSTSLVSRGLAQQFDRLTGQAMVVEHKAGAAGNIGSNLVAKAPPDGYTLLVGTSSLAINKNLYPAMPFDPQADLAPIAMLTSTPNVLAVRGDLPVHSLDDLLKLARSQPGKLTYGSSGVGATNHMAMELLKATAHLDILHVPFKGGGEALSALLGRQIDVMFNPVASVMPHARSGKIRLLAVASKQPVPGLDLPTVSATFPDFESTVWFGLFAPAGTSAAVVNQLNQMTNAALQDEQFRNVLEGAGLKAEGGSSADLRSLLKADTDKWATLKLHQ